MRGYTSDRRAMYDARSPLSRLLMSIVLIWLIIGVIAGWQRHYYDSAPANCANAGTIAVTIVAGPLNYLGVNPKIADCHVDVPQPSQ